MKKISCSTLALLALFLMVSFQSSAISTVSASVWIGQDDAGSCIGRGVCHTSPSSDTAVSPDGIPVTFSLDQLDASVLIIKFKMSHLVSLQPNEATYVAAAALPPSNGITPTYQFDAPYFLNTPMFSSLGLLPNASIQPNSIITVTIVNDIVTMRVQYQHS